MAWIEVHQNLFRHPKTLRAAYALGMRSVQFAGHMCSLWSWALDAKPDGGPLEEIDLRAGADYDGEQDLLPVLLDAGFLDDRNGTFWIHDWEEYAGRLLRQREQARERARNARAASPKRTRTVRAEFAPTEPNPTQPNQTEPEEIDQGLRIKIERMLMESLGIASPALDTIRWWAETYTLQEIEAAIGKAREAGVRRTNYVTGILKGEGDLVKRAPAIPKGFTPAPELDEAMLTPGQREHLATLRARAEGVGT